MALSIGTNCGFVSTAPTTDPAGSAGAASDIDNKGLVSKYTSPATATKITEVGWYCDTATTTANFEVGLYAADGTGGIAGTLLYNLDGTAKGTTADWKVVTGLNWSISPSTAYWIAVRLGDNAVGGTTSNYAASGGAGYDNKLLYLVALPNPFGGGTLADADGMYAFYAKWAAASGPANLKSYSGNLKANIKSISGNLIANVKSLSGNS